MELADKEMARFRKDGLNAEEYDRHTTQFARWLKGHEAKEKSKKGFKGGRGKAFKAILKSAENGDANSQTRVGCMYAKGEDVGQDHQEAAKWFAKAAEQGEPHAQRNLGLLFFKGFGVEKDEARAKEWLDKANNTRRAGFAASSKKAKKIG